MKKIKYVFSMLFLTFSFWLMYTGCGPTFVVNEPPPPRTEIRPAKSYSKAVWIDGHWKWSGGRYVWVPGSWVKPKPGRTWAAGHWEKGPRGWVWVKGHWR